MKQTLYTILLFFCASCIKNPVENPSTEDHTITIRLTTTAENTRVPAVNELNENLIESLYIFFYDEDGQECLFFPSSQYIQHDSQRDIVTVSIPLSALGVLDTNIIIYVVANSKISINPEGNTLEQLQSIVYSTTPTFNQLEFTPQSSFLMDGKIEKVRIPADGTPNLPILELHRAAAKIQVKINSANTNGYEALEAKMRLNNYLDKTTLGSDASLYSAQKDEYMNSPFRPISLPDRQIQNEGPFYSYANDWEYDALVESYITISILWRNTSSSDERIYYYRIPLNYIPDGSDSKKRFSLRRNYIYDFEVSLNGLGSIDPEEAVELSPEFTLRDWTTNKIEVSLNQYDYLLVEDKLVEMHDITHYEIPYISSKRVYIEIDSVFYHLYEADGEITRVDRQEEDGYYPVVIANQETNMINIDCNVPINYVPTYIYFTVIAESGLEQQVNVILYPRQYVTAQYSPGPQGADFGDNFPAGHPNQRNFNFYTITTTSLAPGDPFVLGDPTTREKDPLLGYTRYTNKDEVSNQIISPQFVIASQRGITIGDKISHTIATYRCATYYETPEKYEKGMWRVPTEAELLLVACLQRDPNSALKNLFYPAYADAFWWTARYDEIYQGGVYEGKDVYSVRVAEHENDTGSDLLIKQYNPKEPATPPTNSVRCVYDQWRPYEENLGEYP